MQLTLEELMLVFDCPQCKRAIPHACICHVAGETNLISEDEHDSDERNETVRY